MAAFINSARVTINVKVSAFGKAALCRRLSHLKWSSHMMLLLRRTLYEEPMLFDYVFAIKQKWCRFLSKAGLFPLGETFRDIRWIYIIEFVIMVTKTTYILTERKQCLSSTHLPALPLTFPTKNHSHTRAPWGHNVNQIWLTTLTFCADTDNHLAPCGTWSRTAIW